MILYDILMILWDILAQAYLFAAPVVILAFLLSGFRLAASFRQRPCSTADDFWLWMKDNLKPLVIFILSLMSITAPAVI